MLSLTVEVVERRDQANEACLFVSVGQAASYSAYDFRTLKAANRKSRPEVSLSLSHPPSSAAVVSIVELS